jgi:hypothetical protein
VYFFGGHAAFLIPKIDKLTVLLDMNPKQSFYSAAFCFGVCLTRHFLLYEGTGGILRLSYVEIIM